MLTISVRSYSEEERADIRKQFPSRYKTIENFITALVMLGIFAVVPYTSINGKRGLLIFGQRGKPIDTTRLILEMTGILIIIIMSACWALWRNRRKIAVLQHKMDTGLVEVFHVRTNRIVERKDPEDFGPAFYFEVDYKGDKKTLYLWGQYFYFMEPTEFPCTEFEYIRESVNKNFVSLRPFGKKLEPEMILPPFKKEHREHGQYHDDGDILDQRIDEIIQKKDSV